MSDRKESAVPFIWCAFACLMLAFVASRGCDTTRLAIADDYRLRPVPQSEPLPSLPDLPGESGQADSDPSAAAHDAQPARPVVEVDTMENCVPCAVFEAWHAKEGATFPIAFRVKKHARVLPNRVYKNDTGVPAFFWEDDNGKQVFVAGWSGPETFLASWKQSNPKQWARMAAAPMGAPTPMAGESLADLFGKFAGPGKFAWTPDKPVSAYVDEQTHIEYSRLQGTTKLVGGQPSITLAEPYPVVRVKKWGMWFNAQILGSDSNLKASPPTVTVKTTRGNYTVQVKEAK